MFRFVVIAVTSLMASGCADVLKSSRVNPQTIAVYSGGEARSVLRNRGPGGCPFTKAIGDSNRGAINLDCFRFPEDAGTTNPPAYDRAAQAGSNDRTTAQAKFYRNRLGAVLMKQADDVCTLEKGRMVRTESGGNFLFSLLTTGLSTSSTIVAGERAKTILSALATASNATQATSTRASTKTS